MKVDVSLGELVDKVSILSIKLEKFKDETKKANIKKEFDILKVEMEKAGIRMTSNEFNRLKEVNIKLWNIEDNIRIKELKKEFDDEFIELARSVYFTNDIRADIKKEININFCSDLIEEKEYVDYKQEL